MYRTSGKVLGVVAVIAATGLLGACGDDESTDASTSTSSVAATATSSAESAPIDTGQPAPEQPAPEQPTTTVQSERPQAVPTEAIPPEGSANPAGKDARFLDALAEQGIDTSLPDISLDIGRYVCEATAANDSDDVLATYVNAMAGVGSTFDPDRITVEEAGQIYISTARSTYCE
ncbi:DUF732 domain-containing protein [Nocardia sp. CNY236]|uniref:DUF732 domain-containing protein n=1 Tax=Nocardia sp. CNY236 TaxID=1169152 RepID=UPI000417CBD7|nr:DUF732 domain-containing protein [Nocardia sp. CNY236]